MQTAVTEFQVQGSLHWGRHLRVPQVNVQGVGTCTLAFRTDPHPLHLADPVRNRREQQRVTDRGGSGGTVGGLHEPVHPGTHPGLR